MTISKSSIKVFLLGFLVFVIDSCTGVDSESGYVIKGQIHGISDSTKIYLFNMEDQVNIDSAILRSGLFTMKGIVDHPTFCTFLIPDSKEYATLMVENTKISFESDFKDMNFQSKVTGGYEQSLKNNWSKLTGSYDREYSIISDSLTNGLYEDENHKQDLIVRHRINLAKSHELMRAFLLQNPNSYLTLNFLYRNRHHYPKDTLDKMLENLERKYRENPNALALARYLKEGEVVKGSPFIDFEVNTLSGKPFKLSSLKGNFIYLSFWSTNCPPCRKENRFFSKNYASLPEDLKVVSFSTDKNREKWGNSSEKDNIKWTNVSDLEGDNGLIATRYGVQVLPVSFLIDKNGTIIEKFTGYKDSFYQEILDAMAK